MTDQNDTTGRAAAATSGTTVPAGSDLVRLQGVAIGYGRQVVLSGLDLALARGAFTGLVGANGSGKSTLIRTLLGILPPLAGQIEWQANGGRAPVVGFVPQRETLDDAFLVSSLEVVLMGTCGRVGPGRFFPAAEKEWARVCLREAEAEDLGRRRFSELSGGQKQRVLIARALATRPDLLLLDEPTTGIDAATTRSILELLRRLHARGGLTILMVNHDLPALRQYVRDVIWVHEGRLLRGSVDELLQREKVEELLGRSLA
jgi:ABC-type Mn2+/Zn2+ transport system ATPase subunit